MKLDIENKKSKELPKLSDKALRDEFINTILKYKIENNSYDADFTLEQELEKKLFAENSFLESVMNSVLKAKKDHPNTNIITLFDIDETLATNTYVIDTETKTFVRPSVSTLFQFLKEQGIQIGLLSSRSEIESQLNDAENLESINAYINPELVLSTRNTLSGSDEQRLSEKYKDNMFGIGDLEKISFLENFITNHPDAIIIPVDDLEYPSLFEYGVALSSQEKFFV